MKKIFMLFILAFIVLYTSIFTVKEHQVAFVSNKYNNAIRMYTFGLHFAIPLINKLTYIEVNKRSSALSIKVNTADQKHRLTSYQLNMMIIYHISVPTTYFKYQELNSLTVISKVIANNVKDLIQTKVLQLGNINTLNQIKSFEIEPTFIPELGIVIDNITLTSLQGIHN
ncbi:MAG: hypothetical protein LW807_04190 [Proteobacteria bacterium]|jgi:regulator of protease activity HflC (stomatin/prohibitin superfamily)|nr:hypothetical protein [Pseudomonadota bacterium]